MNRSLLVVLLALVLPLAAVAAQTSPSWDDLAGSSTGPVAAVAAERVVEPARPFVVGRDNLAFQNPWGALKIEKTAGYCYTMALVARLFHEGADFDVRVPSDGRPGFDAAQLASAIENGAGARFTVRGYGSTFAMTASTAPASPCVDAWAQAQVEGRLGLAGPAPATDRDGETLVKVYELLSSIHLLHYFQNQIPDFLRSGLTERLGAPQAERTVTLETLARAEAELGAGRLPIVAMFNTAQVYGHAVLGYRLVVRADTADLYVYDSNLQYGAVRDEAIIRVDRSTGRFAYHKRLSADGRVVPDPYYASSSWFSDAENLHMVYLPGPSGSEADRRLLAAKIRNMEEETGYLLAVGSFLEDVTRAGSVTTTLAGNVRDLVVAMQTVQGRLGQTVAEPLSPTASTVELNRYLANNSAAAVAVMSPYALGEGMALTDTSIRFDAAGNEVTLRTTLAVQADTSVTVLTRAVEGSALLAGRKDLVELLQGLRESFEGCPLSMSLEADVAKVADASRDGGARLVPRLTGTSVVVGAIRPSGTVRAGLHRVEVAEAVLGRVVSKAVDAAGLRGLSASLDYSFGATVKGVGRTFKRVGTLSLDDLGVECTAEGLAVGASVHGFAPVATATRGVNVTSRRTLGVLALSRRQRSAANIFEVKASFEGDLALEGGLTSWGDALVFGVVGKLAEAAFPTVESKVEELASDRLASVLSLTGGSKVDLRDVRAAATGWSFELAPMTVDLSATAKTLFGKALGVEIQTLTTTDDRLVVEARVPEASEGVTD